MVTCSQGLSETLEPRELSGVCAKEEGTRTNRQHLMEVHKVLYFKKLQMCKVLT